MKIAEIAKKDSDTKKADRWDPTSNSVRHAFF